MDRFFDIQDVIIKIHQGLKKFNKYKAATRREKILGLIKLKEELKQIIDDKKT